MAYRIFCERRSIDAESLETFADTMHDAVRMFEHAVIMAVQHGEWNRVQVIPISNRDTDPRPILSYDSKGLDIEVINEEPGTYRWTDERGTVWTRPTANAYASVCKAYNRYRYGEGATPQLYGIEEIGSNKWLSVRGVESEVSYQFSSNKSDATGFDNLADAARQIRALNRAGEAGDFIIEPLN